MKIINILKLFWLLILFNSSATGASTVSLNEYMHTYLEDDESYKNSQLALELGKQNYLISKDLWQSSFSLGDQYNFGNTQIMSSGLENDYKIHELNLSLNQKTPYGTTFSIESFKTLENNLSSSLYSNYTQGFSVSQSLIRNSFGFSDRSKRKSGEFKYKSENSKFKFDKMNHCAQASNLFIKAYSTQETLKAYEDIYQQSNKNLKLIKYKYRKKLITKISYLSSKSDNLNINLLFNSVSKDHKNNIDSLNGILNKPYNPVNLLLKSPESHFGKTFEAGRIEKNSELDSLEELLNSKEMDYKIAKNQSRSDLQIKYQKNISNSQDSLNLEQDDNKVLISWQLPLYNETLRANEQAAWLGKKRALNDLNFAKKNLKTNLKQLSENLRTARENILLSEKKIKILKEQKQESFRLMKSGRFDFQRYVDFRDLYLNEKIAQINRIAQLWVLKSEHLLKTDQISEVCLLGEK